MMGALQIKNIPTGLGDDIKFDASYAKGATKYVIGTAGTSPSFAMFGGTSNPGAYESIGLVRRRMRSSASIAPVATVQCT